MANTRSIHTQAPSPAAGKLEMLRRTTPVCKKNPPQQQRISSPNSKRPTAFNCRPVITKIPQAQKILPALSLSKGAQPKERPSAHTGLAIQRCFNKAFEHRDIIFAGIPNNFCVNAKILMDKEVSHVLHSTPLNLCIYLLELWAEVIGGFANYLQFPYYCINNHLAGGKLLIGNTLQILLNGLNCIPDMSQICSVISHRHTQPAVKLRPGNTCLSLVE